jgi:hypothetical protein
MNCQLFDDVLDDYVDGVRVGEHRDDERFAAFAQHLTECAPCRALVTDLTSIKVAVSRLDEHVPSPRLWAKIASSIEQRQRQPWWQRELGGGFSAWIPATAAASVVILLFAAAWDGWNHRRTELPPPPSSADVQPIPAEQHYERAIAGLQQVADAQNAVLDPETLAVVRKNLAVIDRAIDESRAALVREPASTLAQESLLDALESKVTLLQDTVALSSDAGVLADDAATAAKELNQ